MEDLNTFETGITTIETARQSGIELIPDGATVNARATQEGYDKAQADYVVALLRRNRKELLQITADQDGVRTALSHVQDSLAEANAWFSEQLDLWHRLVQVYYYIFSDDKRCVRGDDGCRDDAVTWCWVCAERRQSNGV